MSRFLSEIQGKYTKLAKIVKISISFNRLVFPVNFNRNRPLTETHTFINLPVYQWKLKDLSLQALGTSYGFHHWSIIFLQNYADLNLESATMVLNHFQFLITDLKFVVISQYLVNMYPVRIKSLWACFLHLKGVWKESFLRNMMSLFRY